MASDPGTSWLGRAVALFWAVAENVGTAMFFVVGGWAFVASFAMGGWPALFLFILSRLVWRDGRGS